MPAPGNRSLTLSPRERTLYRRRLLRLDGPAKAEEIENRTVCQDLLEVIDWLPDRFAGLLFLDPPYNLRKRFGRSEFRDSSVEDYAGWLESWLPRLLRTLRADASVYICGDWRSAPAIHLVGAKYLELRNRITWEREKGRGAKANWKSASEDIFFFTVCGHYTFNLDEVKLRRRVIAPYTDERGRPKDWQGGYRLTHPSNLWTDLTVPFWSMPENTEHPTQKPEKLLAKIILASTNPGDLVFDPFLGSGTASVAAKKLGRRWLGIEREERYCCLAEKRLALAETGGGIQGYHDGIFRERNSP